MNSMERAVQSAKPKTEVEKKEATPKGGRPRNTAAQVRQHKHTLFLSEAEEKLLQQLMNSTGQDAADLFRHALLAKGLRIPKARIASPELMELLTDFKKKSGLITLLSHRERDFTAEERNVLVGSSSSMRTAIERLQRSVFLSLEKGDELEEIKRLVEVFSHLLENTKAKQALEKPDWQTLEKLLHRLVRLLNGQYQYLNVSIDS